MKKKPFEKKLTLKKTTLTNLDPSQLQGVKGGLDSTVPGRTIEKLCYINSCVECTWFPICEGTYYC
jgi:hypothetical protein